MLLGIAVDAASEGATTRRLEAARVLSAADQHARASEVLGDPASYDDDSAPEAYLIRARARWTAGDIDGANEDVSSGLQVAPQGSAVAIELMLERASNRALTGEAEEALREAEIALDLAQQRGVMLARSAGRSASRISSSETGRPVSISPKPRGSRAKPATRTARCEP